MATNANPIGVLPEAILTLLDERTQFQRWLATLDDVQSDFRPAVTSRVRQDYEERLHAVESRLTARTAALESLVADQFRALEELAVEHKAGSADLEEAQLRHAVGEYPTTEWEQKRTECHSVLDDLHDRVLGARTTLEELAGLLSKVTGRTGSILAMQALPDFYEVQRYDDEPGAPVESVPVVTGSVARRNQGDDVFLAELEFLEGLSTDTSPSFDNAG